MERKKNCPCELKNLLEQKQMAKIAQWRERKIVRVNFLKLWMKTDGNSLMERKKNLSV